MRFAIADPPYVGQAKRHYAKEAAAAGRVASEVDHRALLERLETYDGWALCLSSPSLLGPDGIAAMCPPGVRIGAWVKPFASFKRGVDPAYAWEPVIYRTAREWRKEQATVRDWWRDYRPPVPDAVAACITLKRGVSGAKPAAFSFWLFELLGMTPADTLDDLFPGSGAITRAWNTWRGQLEIA